MNINFYCSESRANKKGLADIVVTIGIKGYKRITVPLPMKYSPQQFTKEMTTNKGGIAREYCEKVRASINKHISDMTGQDIDPEELKEFITNGCKEKTYTLDDMFTGFLSIQNARVGAEISQEMYDRYITAKKKFYDDLSLTGNEAANTINYDRMATYKAEQLKKYKTSTVSTYLNKIKAVFKYAFNNGKLTVFPFEGIVLKKGYNSDDIKYLTQKEIDTIEDKEFSTDRLTKVRDCFLFQCYSGLAYVDMKGLIEDDIKQDQETKLYYIKKNRQKTGVEFFSILLGSAVEIITKYEFKLPVPTNQKMNAYLKEIADLCNIDKEITTHMGRHTYGTLLLSNGFGIEMVAKCLGHDPSDTKITARYAKIFDTSLLEKGEKLQAKLIKKAIDKIIKG